MPRAGTEGYRPGASRLERNHLLAHSLSCVQESFANIIRLEHRMLAKDLFVYTGLWPGEKLAEDLWTSTEDLEATAQGSWSSARPRPRRPTSSGSMESLERSRGRSGRTGRSLTIVPVSGRVLRLPRPMFSDGPRLEGVRRLVREG
jgi:hypothetical protein